MFEKEKQIAQPDEVGFVSDVRNYFVYVKGLPGATVFEEVVFESGEMGFIFALNRDTLEVVLLTPSRLSVGTKASRTGKKVVVKVGKELAGMHVDALGRNKNLKLTGNEERDIDTPPPPLSRRIPVRESLETGVAVVDAMVPLARGQRELVVGDRKTGKTSFLLQTMLHQAKLGVLCIYAAVGKKEVDIYQLIEFIKANGIRDNVIIVSSRANDTPGFIYLTPYTAMTIAEYFRDQGRDTLVIMDDLSTHANTYREISLLTRRFPGRSAYPGDIFFTHSRLMERAGSFSFDKDRGVNITCLPVAQSVLGDITGYITTNLMSMTDGHIYFDTEMFDKGRRPAVNTFTSVTRVGRQTQNDLAKQITRKLSAFLVEYGRISDFLHFGSEIGQSSKDILQLGGQLTILFDQNQQMTVPKNLNLYLICVLWSGAWRSLTPDNQKNTITNYIKQYQTNTEFRGQVDQLVTKAKSIEEVVDLIKKK